MLAELLDVLRCPVCADRFVHHGSALRCPQRHTFDIARQGYVNLLAGVPSRTTADTADMVRARDEFLTAGHYEALATALADAAAGAAQHAARHAGQQAQQHTRQQAWQQAGQHAGQRVAERAGPPDSPGDHPVVLDAGAGTGYYGAAVLDRVTGSRGLALDASKFAARHAARAHPRLAAAVWDAWRPWPVADESVGVLLNVFAPRNAAEFSRVLGPGGTALVVTPTPDHLAELVEPLGMLTVDSHKDERLDESLAGHLTLVDREELTFPLTLHAADVGRLVRMGPSGWHIDDATLDERLATLDDPAHATASVTIAGYRKA